MKHLDVQFLPGDQVLDCLTGKTAIVSGVTAAVGKVDGRAYLGTVVAYYLDTDYLYGARHPWEVTSVPSAQVDNAGT